MINEKKDACYHKVKSRYSVWPSAYASGALVKCRKKGAKNWGNSRKDEALHTAYFNFAASLVSEEDAFARNIRRAQEADQRAAAAKSEAEKQAAAEQEKAFYRRIEREAKRGMLRREIAANVGASTLRKLRKKFIQRKLQSKPEERRGDPQKRTDLDQRLADKIASEQEARAAARGTTRRRVTYSIGTDPKTGERKVIGKKEGGNPVNYVRRLARAKGQQLKDSPLQTIKGVARGVKGSTYGAFQAGRASQRAKRQRIDFSHTEYQRIGAILAEAKGVMPKKFSVKSGDKSAAGGLTAKGVKRYRAANPGSKLKTAVTTKPSKLKKGSKAASRRKSFCARMGGMKKRLTSSKTANDPNSRINKALRKWNC